MERMQKEVTTSTPWGRADMVTPYGRGINFYTTPAHGGFKLSEKLNALVPEYFRNAAFAGLGLKGWYEEDCDWAIVAVVFPSFFNDAEIKLANESLERYLPAEYAAFKAGHRFSVNPGAEFARRIPDTK